MGPIIGLKDRLWEPIKNVLRNWKQTNRERIEQLETGLSAMQEGLLHKMKLGMADRLYHLEGTLNRFSDVLLSNQESRSHTNHHRKANNRGWQVVSSKTAKLEFPWFSCNDPTKWFNQVNQFFKFQGTPEGFISLLPPRRKGQPVVAMDS